MFYYYGAKNQLAGHYPKPLYNTIIEPFAGSAGYAQHYRSTPDRKVILVEKDPVIAGLWRRLQSMSADEILALPTPVPGTYCDDPFIDQLVKMAAASNGVMKMTGPLRVPTRVGRVWEMQLRRMAARVDEIKAWKIVEGDYTKSPTRRPATWFIDPPYQLSSAPLTVKTSFPKGMGYKYNAIDYSALRDWCRTLKGQVIVCEQGGADWLADFQPLKMHSDSQGIKREEVFMTWTTEVPK